MPMLRGTHLPWNFSWVDEKKLAGTSVPTTESQMKALVSEGISHLVSLSPETPPFTGPVEGLKITYIGVEDFEAPTPKQIRKFLKVCESGHARGEAVTVHCRGGRGRTGTVGSKTTLSSILKDNNLLNNTFYALDAGSLLHVEGEPGREVSGQLGEERPTGVGRVQGTI